MRLEYLRPDATVHGILPDASISVVNVSWHGSDALPLVYRTPSGGLANDILFRHNDFCLEIVETSRPWSFDGGGAAFLLLAVANGIPNGDHALDDILSPQCAWVTCELEQKTPTHTTSHVVPEYSAEVRASRLARESGGFMTEEGGFFEPVGQ